METYRGPATLILDSGAELSVGADLVHRGDWGGFITLAGADWDVIANHDRGQLRLPSGSEGDFVRPNPAEMPPVPAQTPFRIRILGSGDCPF